MFMVFNLIFKLQCHYHISVVESLFKIQKIKIKSVKRASHITYNQSHHISSGWSFFYARSVSERGGFVIHSLLTDLPLAFRDGCAHFPMSLELIWVLYECTILNVYGSQCVFLDW